MHHEIHDNQLYLQRLAEEKEHLTNDFLTPMAAVQGSSELVWKGSLIAAQQCTRRERVDRVGLADQQTLDPAIPRLSLPRTKAIKQPLQLNRPGVPYLITRVSLDARLGRHPE